MGIQLLEGDWTATASAAAAAAAVGDTVAGAGIDTSATSAARQKRWTAFRSWYRGGRVFDRAHESLIAAAVSHPLPSPASQGRPLTPRLIPTDRTPPEAPSMGTEDGGVQPEAVNKESVTVTASPGAHQPLDGNKPPVGAVEEPAGQVTVEQVTTGVVDVPTRVRSRPQTTLTADAKVHVMTLSETSAPSLSMSLGKGDAVQGNNKKAKGSGSDAGGMITTSTGSDEALAHGMQTDGEKFADDVSADSLVGWVDDRVELANNGESAVGHGAEKVPPIVVTSGSEAAKRLRMESRRKFLAARTVSSKAAAIKVGSDSAYERSGRRMVRSAEAWYGFSGTKYLRFSHKTR